MKKRTRETSAPEITPLIDVVFLLLIFFMVSTVFKKDELALLLNLPKASKGESTEQSEKKILLIELSKDEMALNGKVVKLPELDQQLEQIKDNKMPVDLRIDKDVRYEKVIELLDKLKKFNFENLSLITDS